MKLRVQIVAGIVLKLHGDPKNVWLLDYNNGNILRKVSHIISHHLSVYKSFKLIWNYTC